jgi:hypothetical protein
MMGMLLDALRIEIDQIRKKIHVDKDGNTELLWYKFSREGTLIDGVKLENLLLNASSVSQLTESQVDELERHIFEGDGKSFSTLCREIEVNYRNANSIRIKWKKAGRYNYRPITKEQGESFLKNINSITKSDLIATIAHYLPNWPTTVLTSSDKHYRVYHEKAGILQGTYKDEFEAKKEADRIGGIYIEVGKRKKFPIDEYQNPAEKIYSRAKHRRNGKCTSPLGQKFLEFFPKTLETVRDSLLPTTYDWSIFFLYALAITGWNQEAIRSISRLDVARKIKSTKGPYDLLDDNIATFVVSIDPEIEENDEGEICLFEGEKFRGQKKGEPRIYTYHSRRNEPYDLFRLLQDLIILSAPAFNYLRGDDINRIFVGFSPASVHPETPVFVRRGHSGGKTNARSAGFRNC